MAIKIMIDCGHYTNYNQGAYKPYYEGNMTWTLGKYLTQYLKSYGFTVANTRTAKNYDVSVYNRGCMAKGYDVFLSLHSNSCDDSSIQRVVIIKGYDQGDTLAKKFGKAITDVMNIDEKYQIYTKKTSSGGEYYGVLRGAKAVGVANRFILECGFHSNYSVAKWLYSDENIKKLAKSIADTLASHYGYTKKEEDFREYIVRVTANNLNGRKGAGTSFAIETVLPKGTAVTIVDEQGNWLKTKSGYYIHKDYVEFVRYV